MEIKIGCCGWCESHKKYFRDFKILEIQETFYQPRSLSKYKKWRGEAPEDFEFVIKCWQLITHAATSPTYRRLKMEIPKSRKKNFGYFKPTKEVFKAWEKMREIIKALNAKIILFQCPVSFGPTRENKENMKEFFKEIERKDYIFVWEPRGEWKEEEIKQICKELNLVHCVDPFKKSPIFGKINYFRLHGKPGYNLRYKYTENDLREIKDFCDKKINYVLFNNYSMLKDAQRFQKLL